MRVLILATDIYTRGGIARYTRTLAEALGWLLGAENVDVLPLLGDTGPTFASTRYHTLEPTTNTLNLPAKVRHIARSLLCSRKRYDLVVCSHLGLTPLAALIKACHKTPYFVACYGAEAWSAFPLPVRLGVKRADLLLPISRHTRGMLHRVNGVSQEKMYLLYPAVPDDLASLLTVAKRTRVSGPCAGGRERILLSAGNLGKPHRYKGFDTVIHALPGILEAVPEVQYVIVGDGDDRPYLERLSAEMGVAEHVKFAGSLTDEELAAHYRACDLFVLPSRARQHIGHWDGEGFGIVYIEAALAGKAVVGSLGGGAAEAVLHRKTGLLVDPVSVKEIGDAIITLLANPDLASRMGREGRWWASQRFTTTGLRSSLKDLLRHYGYTLNPEVQEQPTCGLETVIEL